MSEKIKERTADKAIPKYKPNYIVYDREMHKEYRIEAFWCHQLNGDVWYTAFDTTTLDKFMICEYWLTLIRRAT